MWLLGFIRGNDGTMIVPSLLSLEAADEAKAFELIRDHLGMGWLLFSISIKD